MIESSHGMAVPRRPIERWSSARLRTANSRSASPERLRQPGGCLEHESHIHRRNVRPSAVRRQGVERRADEPAGSIDRLFRRRATWRRATCDGIFDGGHRSRAASGELNMAIPTLRCACRHTVTVDQGPRGRAQFRPAGQGRASTCRSWPRCRRDAPHLAVPRIDQGTMGLTNQAATEAPGHAAILGYEGAPGAPRDQ